MTWSHTGDRPKIYTPSLPSQYNKVSLLESKGSSEVQLWVIIKESNKLEIIFNLEP
jgi:hypothetical protein